jgi:hypothetical protein
VTDAFGLELLDFLCAVDAGGAMEASGDEGLRDLACSMAVLESSTTGCRVRFSDVLEGRVDAYQREIDAHYGIKEAA